MTDSKHKLLKKYWGYDSFRPLQEEIIDSVLQGHDTLALLPTGGGKSLCYQLPALLREGVCLVVSPLIALMKDQVQQLNDRKIRSACIVSGFSHTEVSGILNNAVCGVLKLLYVSPERLLQRSFIEHFKQMKVGLIAVDEAHCISQWGYDFRPPYLQIAAIRQWHPEAPLIALTATATPMVADDICQRLEMRNCRRFRSSFVRPNLAYMVLHEGDKMQRLLRIVRRVGGSGIVYTRSRRTTEVFARFLDTNGIRATAYHAGLDARERDHRQSLWMAGTCQVMVATNAFGMGIDKPDVRFVVHTDVPDSLEAYFQEAGRAGRDGQPSYAVLVCDPSDRARLQHDFDTDFPTLKYVRNIYRALCNFYRIPLGSGAGAQFDFKIEEICKYYNFSPREFYSACKVLEREGLISIPDREDSSSMLSIPVSRDELYRFQVDHQRLGELLQVVIRMYPGLMDTPVPIDEERIASRTYSKGSEVVAMLAQMHEMHVVTYHSKPKGPQIIFDSERINEGQIYPMEQNYEGLKQAARQRMEAMRDYLSNDAVCRSRQLVAYFGEEASHDCQRCDVCLHHQAKPANLREAVRQMLKQNAMEVNGLTTLLKEKGFEDISDTLREMLDCGEVTLDRDAVLHLA